MAHGHASRLPAADTATPDKPLPRYNQRITGSLDDHTLSPVVARKLAALGGGGADEQASNGNGSAAPGTATHFSTGARGSLAAAAPASGRASVASADSAYEEQLAEARLEAFRARQALVAKHAEFVRPAAPAALQQAGSVGGEGDAAAGSHAAAAAAAAGERAASNRRGRSLRRSPVARDHADRLGDHPAAEAALPADVVGGDLQSSAGRERPRAAATHVPAAAAAASQAEYAAALEVARREAFAARQALAARARALHEPSAGLATSLPYAAGPLPAAPRPQPPYLPEVAYPGPYPSAVAPHIAAAPMPLPARHSSAGGAPPVPPPHRGTGDGRYGGSVSDRAEHRLFAASLQPRGLYEAGYSYYSSGGGDGAAADDTSFSSHASSYGYSPERAREWMGLRPTTATASAAAAPYAGADGWHMPHGPMLGGAGSGVEGPGMHAYAARSAARPQPLPHFHDPAVAAGAQHRYPPPPPPGDLSHEYSPATDTDQHPGAAAGGEPGGPSVSQLRAARLAAEQQAYEDSLVAARRQAFEERLALQARFGRGSGFT
jgi:hypothetical protein